MINGTNRSTSLDYFSATQRPVAYSVRRMDRYYDALTLPMADLELTRPAWHRQAACRGMGTDLFFLDRGESVAPALELCGGCQVVAECREAGLGTRYGIWGGATAHDRVTLRAERRAG